MADENEVQEEPLDPWLRALLLMLVDIPMGLVLFTAFGWTWWFAGAIAVWWITRFLHNCIYNMR